MRALLLLTLSSLAVSCTGAPVDDTADTVVDTDGDTDGDTDADTDADSDTDPDSDTDSGTDGDTDTDTDTGTDTAAPTTTVLHYDPACEDYHFNPYPPFSHEDDQWIAARVDTGVGDVVAVRTHVVHLPPGEPRCDASGPFRVLAWVGGSEPPAGTPPGVDVSLEGATPQGTCSTETCRVLEVDLSGDPLTVGSGQYLWVAVQAYHDSYSVDDEGTAEQSCFATCDGPDAGPANRWVEEPEPADWLYNGGTVDDWSQLFEVQTWVEADLAAR